MTIRSVFVAAALALVPFVVAAETQSLACAFLTPDVAAAWGKTGAQSDGGPAQYGMSNCTWRADDMSVLMVTLMEGEAISGRGGVEKTFDAYARSSQAATKASPEAIDGLGDAAILLLEGEGAYQSAVVMIRKGERIVSLSFAQIDRERAVAVSQVIGGAM